MVGGEEFGGFLEDFVGGGERGGVIGVLVVLSDVMLEHEEFFFCLLLLVLFELGGAAAAAVSAGVVGGVGRGVHLIWVGSVGCGGAWFLCRTFTFVALY